MTTGTGSGKTEAFLYPILDHVRRAKRTTVSDDGLVSPTGRSSATPPRHLADHLTRCSTSCCGPSTPICGVRARLACSTWCSTSFHTYDGAQGTDVSMPLPRLGLTLKSYWAADDPVRTVTDRTRPDPPFADIRANYQLGEPVSVDSVDDDPVLAAMQHPAARMQFAFIEDNDELRAAVENPDITARRWWVFAAEFEYCYPSCNHDHSAVSPLCS